MTSILDINTVTRFLIKNPQISINQFFFCMMHLYDEQHCRRKGYSNIQRPMSLLYAYFGKKKEPFTQQEIKHLIEEGYIEKIGNNVKIDMVRVTPKFKKEFFGEVNFEEFFDLYPSFMPNFNHPSQPDIKLKATNKEELERIYLSKIKTEESHKRVLEITEKAKQMGEINMNISNYVKGEMWDQLDEIDDQTFEYQTQI